MTLEISKPGEAKAPGHGISGIVMPMAALRRGSDAATDERAEMPKDAKFKHPTYRQAFKYLGQPPEVLFYSPQDGIICPSGNRDGSYDDVRLERIHIGFALALEKYSMSLVDALNFGSSFKEPTISVFQRYDAHDPNTVDRGFVLSSDPKRIFMNVHAGRKTVGHELFHIARIKALGVEACDHRHRLMRKGQQGEPTDAHGVITRAFDEGGAELFRCHIENLEQNLRPGSGRTSMHMSRLSRSQGKRMEPHINKVNRDLYDAAKRSENRGQAYFDREVEGYMLQVGQKAIKNPRIIQLQGVAITKVLLAMNNMDSGITLRQFIHNGSGKLMEEIRLGIIRDDGYLERITCTKSGS